jgi:hypothetical protein
VFHQAAQTAQKIPPPAAIGSPLLQRKCGCGGGGCACDEKKPEMQRKAASPSEAGGSPSMVHDVLRSSGQPLESTTRASMESWFAHDFSQIRIHTDTRAAQSAQEVNALAYTVGRDIVFGQNQYAPSTTAGRKLLAHELTHTIQQSQNPASTALMSSSIQVNKEGDAYEQEADRVSAAFGTGARPQIQMRPASSLVQRQTGIAIKEAKPFGHADLKSDELKKANRTYVGSTTLMQVTPAADYKGHCVKEYLTEVANNCPARFQELRKEPFCNESKCLEFARWGTSGDPETGKNVTDGPDTFIDRHRTRNPESLLEGTGKNECSVVCHQRYKFDRKTDLGSFYIIRNFRADTFKPAGEKTALHITTGEVKKVPAALDAPTKEKFAKDIAPGLVKSGDLRSAPTVPKSTDTPKGEEKK